jgi:hypothetical protein
MTKLENTDDKLGNLAAILSHICLVLYMVPPQASDPLVVVALNTLQLIQERVTQSTTDNTFGTKFNPVHNVLNVLGEREDAAILNKKLKMFLKLYD